MGRRVYADLDTFFRSNLDITMQDLADELDVSLTHLSLIRWGHRAPRLGLACRIRDRCSIPIDSLNVENRQQKEKAS